MKVYIVNEVVVKDKVSIQEKNYGHNVVTNFNLLKIKVFRGRIEVVLQIESLLRYRYYIDHTSQRSGEIHYFTPRAS